MSQLGLVPVCEQRAARNSPRCLCALWQSLRPLAAVSRASADDGSVAVKLKPVIGYLGKSYAEPEPLSLVDKIVTDKGIQGGARIGLSENNMTGRLIGHA